MAYQSTLRWVKPIAQQTTNKYHKECNYSDSEILRVVYKKDAF